jgi:ATP-dependent DNA helicase RecG
MMLTEEEFAVAFPAENDFIERKLGVSGKALQDAAVAFSNAEGGVVLIGVDDSGVVYGKEPTPGTELAIHRALSETRNLARYWLHRLVVGEKPITVLAVDQGMEGLAQTPNGRPLIRKGASNAPLFGAELQRLVAERSLKRFDAGDSGVPLAQASDERVAWLATAFEWSGSVEVSERLEEHGLVVSSPGGPHLTVAGALYLLDSPHETLGKAYVEVLRYPDGRSEYDKRVQVEGPADIQVERATELIMDELGTELVVLGLHRHELPRLPRVVVREAIANAVAHRSYEINGSSICVELHPGMVKITSPGPLPTPVTVQNIRETNSARNVTVINVLRRLRLAEDVGRGVDVMQDTMMEELLDPPRFEDTGHSVEVTLPVRGAITPPERAWVKEIEARGTIEPMDRVLLVQAARGGELTNSLVRKLAHVDRLVATTALQRLRDAGFLVQRGERGGATYQLHGSLEPPAGLRLDDAELKQMVLELAGDGSVKNADIRARTGLDRVAALQLLDELVQEGRLMRQGKGRGIHYVLTGDEPS